MTIPDPLEDVSYWPNDRCWFCGDPAAARYAYLVGLHRNPQTTFLALGLIYRDEWQVRAVEVPRCRRCRVGHRLDTLLLLVAIPTFAWGMGLLLDTMLGTYTALPLVPSTVPRIAVWFLPSLAWLSVRFGWFGLRKWFPRHRRFVRRHPIIMRLFDDGWKYGRAPLRQWDRRWS